MALHRILILILLSLGTRAYASEFTVDEWFLASSVMTNGVGSEGAYFEDVVQPFTESHEVELGASNASASYDFAWDDTGGHFRIDSQLAAEVVDGLNHASTYGWIKIRPSVDLAVHVDASFEYNLPTHLLEAMLDVRSGKFQHTLFDEYREHDTLSDGIGSGTLSFSGDFVMPAGDLWRLSYDMDLDTDPWSPGAVGQVATGSGSVCFSFTVLPEPSTLGLLATSGFLMLRRRRP